MSCGLMQTDTCAEKTEDEHKRRILRHIPLLFHFVNKHSFSIKEHLQQYQQRHSFFFPLIFHFLSCASLKTSTTLLCCLLSLFKMKKKRLCKHSGCVCCVFQIIDFPPMLFKKKQQKVEGKLLENEKISLLLLFKVCFLRLLMYFLYENYL
jgi:hypothetical protein